MATAGSDSTATSAILQRIDNGDRRAVERLFARHRGYLRQVIEMRLDRRLRARVDPSDVVQETELTAFQQLSGFLAQRGVPFRVWLRRTAQERLIDVRRRHLDADRRAVSREISLPDRSALYLAHSLLADQTSPSRLVARAELIREVRRALAELPEIDREVLLLRNFESLSNTEAAYVLGISPDAASKRLGRAVIRLRVLLQQLGISESKL